MTIPASDVEKLREAAQSLLQAREHGEEISKQIARLTSELRLKKEFCQGEEKRILFLLQRYGLDVSLDAQRENGMLNLLCSLTKSVEVAAQTACDQDD